MDPGTAISAVTIFYLIGGDCKTPAFHDSFFTLRADCIFVIGTGDVPDIHVIDPGFACNGIGLFKSGEGRIRDTRKFIEGEEPAEMQWDIRKVIENKPL